MVTSRSNRGMHKRATQMVFRSRVLATRLRRDRDWALAVHEANLLRSIGGQLEGSDKAKSD